MNNIPYTPKIAIKCKICGRTVAYKLGSTTGFIQVKCPKCGSEMKLDLSLRQIRRSTDFNQRPSYYTFPI